jgi:hypothetical protein
VSAEKRVLEQADAATQIRVLFRCGLAALGTAVPAINVQEIAAMLKTIAETR